MYEHSLVKVVEPIKKQLSRGLIVVKNGNMDTIKNMILSLYQKAVQLVTYLKSKVCALRCRECQAECFNTKKTNG